MHINCNVATLNVEIEGAECPAMEILKSELSIYSDKIVAAKTDFKIQFCEPAELANQIKVRSRNPSTFADCEDGFAIDFGPARVYWSKDSEPIKIICCLPSAKQRWRTKLRSMQYSYRYETIGQIFHELILIPTLQLFYSDRMAVVHGSALTNSENEAFVFGGTGGVGKTSLMLELVGEQGYKFLADDISIINEQGAVLANLAFPKIYGYNTLGYPEMRRKLMEDRPFLDRMAWVYQMKRNGPQSVRRRINPMKFFGKRVALQGALKHLFILFRRDQESLTVENVSAEEAVQMNINIMKSEYVMLYKHLYWYEFNCLGRGTHFDPQFSFHKLWKNSQRIQSRVLENVHCKMINVPLEMTAQELKQQMAHRLESLDDNA